VPALPGLICTEFWQKDGVCNKNRMLCTPCMMRRYALNALDAARNLGDGVHEHFSDAPDDDNTAL